MSKPYRDGVVTVVTSDFLTYLVGERSDLPNSWQFPQGGVDPEELPDDAALRELAEETSIKSVRMIRKSADWISYSFPESLSAKITDKYSGQRQIWYLFKLHEVGKNEIAESSKEFSRFSFKTLDEILDGTVDWKRPSYEAGLKALELGKN